MSEGALAARWARLRAARRTALIPYVTAGHPTPEETLAFLRGAGAAGADFVELGVPWSDPVADGPMIQASTHAALERGMTLTGALALLERAAVPPDLPVIVFSYLNPILALGADAFAAAARRAGAAGILVTDLPAGDDPALEARLGASLPLVRLVAPTTPPGRQRTIAAASRGFLYLIARLGVTGESGTIAATVAPQVASLRAATELPIAVGFGVSTPAQAAELGSIADGVVIGSAVVSRMGQGGAAAALAWLGSVRAALDARA